MKKFIISFIAALGFIVPSGACTTAIVSAGASSTGKPLLWKQRDMSNVRNTAIYVPSTDSSYAYTAIVNISSRKHKNVYAGENEKGFAVINNMSYNISDSKEKVSNGILMRLALEKCATVDEFEAFVRNMPHRTCKANFGAVDASGAAAYIEAGDSIVARYDVPEGGYLVRTNFSLAGTPDGPSGYARYESAKKIMSSHKGKFSPLFLIDALGRSFYNDVLGYDAFRRGGLAYDEDFIARPTTVSSVCFDGTGVMWAAVGYTPAIYAMPIECCRSVPQCLKAANALAEKIKTDVHPLPRDAAKKYIDFKKLRPVMKIVRRYEKKASALSGRNDALDRLFSEFKKEIEAL